jgi:signal transduction histidine kinase
VNEKAPLIDLIIHDLTGPLSIASTSTESLLRKEDRYGPLSDRQRQTLERVLRNCNKAQRLVQEMIEIYRSEEGLFRKDAVSLKATLMESVLDAVEVVAPTVADSLSHAADFDDFQRILGENGIVVKIEGPYGAAPFCHDQKKMELILRNLVSNAMKYRRARITISLSGDRDLVVAVEDDGEGIPAEKQGYIFQRFFQVRDKPGTDIQKGLGFGLSCVKKLVETMKGDIGVMSGEGQGTCFTVRIPPLEANT